MSLEHELVELLASLGVVLEHEEGAPRDREDPRRDGRDASAPACQGPGHASGDAGDGDDNGEGAEGYEDDLTAEHDRYGEAEVSLFQTSREHYGVFYRLDLVAGAPQLRVFTPAEGGAVKMACYLVRGVPGAPVREWFRVTRGHVGSSAYDDARDATEQHLLFAAGESLKHLFWAGDTERMRFPAEIAVTRVL